MLKIAENIYQRRKEKNITQEELRLWHILYL